MKIKRSIFTTVGIFLFSSIIIFAQNGMMVGPSKVYYKVEAGGSGNQKIIATNNSNEAIEIGVSISDWAYSVEGDNLTYAAGKQLTTCADWIQILPGAYLTLQPKEKKELTVVLNVPQNANKEIPVHTAMLLFTQLNASDRKLVNGTQMNISVRIGIKLYHSFAQQEARDIEITDFKDFADSTNATAGRLELAFHNNSKIWVDGKVNWELLNSQTGEKKKLEDTDFYTLPGDNRILHQVLPAKLVKGKYTATAIINYGSKEELKIAELEFAR